jgi:hypothetical protein
MVKKGGGLIMFDILVQLKKDKATYSLKVKDDVTPDVLCAALDWSEYDRYSGVPMPRTKTMSEPDLRAYRDQLQARIDAIDEILGEVDKVKAENEALKVPK